MPYKTTVLLTVLLLVAVSSCSTSSKIADTQITDPHPVVEMPADSLISLDTLDAKPSAEDLLDEAKIEYSNALICVYDNDTTGARFHFEEAMDLVRQVQDLSMLEPWAEDESILFTQKITEDYVHYIKNKEEKNSGYRPTSLQEQISLLEPIEEIEWENGEFKVLDDRDGHIPIILNARVERIIDFLQTRRKTEFQKYLNRMNRFEDLFKGILADYNLPPELFYLALIESGLNPRAYSYAYAAGPWQFIYSTGKHYDLNRTWYVDERYDPVKSTHAAAQHLSKLYKEFGDWYLAMAAYNSGERRIWRAIRREGTRDFWNMRTLPRQTRNYVPTVLAATIIATHPEEYGFHVRPEPVWEADTVQLKKGYEFQKIASSTGISVDILRDLNPEIRKDVTPTNIDTYTLRIPKGNKERFLAQLDDIPEAGKRDYATHYVSYGETLSLIANKYHVAVRSIMAANNLRSSHWIRVGQRLTIPLSGSYVQSRTASSSASSASRTKSIPTDVPGHTKVVYLVKHGDTLGAIAEAYNTRAQKIRDWNGLDYGQYIYPGNRLNIWVPENSEFASAETGSEDEASASGQSAEESQQIHVVQWRDTLWDIARQYGVDVNSLQEWNPEVSSGNIKPGDRIRILSE